MFKKLQFLATILLGLSLALSFPTGSKAAETGQTVRISVMVGGQEANSDSSNAAISADGRYVAFDSYASNLVSDTNNTRDVFVRNTLTGLVSRVSIAGDGSQSNNESSTPAISRDGRYVAFQSAADNLVANDTNNSTDIFVRDTTANSTTRVSLAWDGSQANASSFNPSISADGRYVAFASDADNLVSGDTNLASDIFVRDLQAGETTRVSVSRNGLIVIQANGASYSPVISADGSLVAYESYAYNLVSGDNNGNWDIFRTMVQFALTERISVSSVGSEASGASHDPAMSGDGRYIAFESDAGDLVGNDNNYRYDIFVRDTQTSTTSRVSVASNGVEGNENSTTPSISDDGRFIAFESYASTLVGGDSNSLTDIFVRDTQVGVTIRVSVASDGTQGNGSSPAPNISADGRFVVFESGAENLVSGDNNSAFDIFRHAVNKTATFTSQGKTDGWVLESSETSKKGGTLDAGNKVLYLGDDASNKQYRDILSFSTSGLPDNAIITKVTLKFKKQGVSGGGNPVIIFKGFMVDIKNGFFGTSALRASDFQAKANKTFGPFNTAITGGWYSIDLTSSKSYLNMLASNGGLTQIRLRFNLDDNNNYAANILKLYSGNAPAASRPQLIVEYYVP